VGAFSYLRCGRHVSQKLHYFLKSSADLDVSGLIASILRFTSFFNTNSFTDATFNAVELISWTVAEPGIYLISASLLVFRPLLDKIRPSRRSKTLPSLDLLTDRKTKATAKALDTSYDDFGGHGGIAMVQRSVHGGFKQLRDDDNSPHRREGITVITDIEQNWNDRDRS
jgi:hypothetical protein